MGHPQARAAPDTFVTHDAIRGEVTAVSASSITVKAADGVSARPTRSPAPPRCTCARPRPARGAPERPATIGDVHTGDKVAVTGTGTTSLTAEHIVDRAE